MNQALIYCRVSTEEQAKEGHHSISTQKTICEKMAKDSGYQIGGIFEDLGRSATNMNRPALKDLLLRCQEDKSISAIFVQDTDRLARNTQNHLAIRAILKKNNIKLISASQPMVEDSAEGNMIDTIIASVNQFQSELSGRKTLKAMQEKARNGWWPTMAPMGYKNIRMGEEGKISIIAVDEKTAPLIKELFQLFTTGNYSVLEVRDIMHQKGLRSMKGYKIQRSQINAILKNSFYIGEIKWEKIEAKGKHPPLIDEKTFKTAQEILLLHGGRFCRRRKHFFLLRGFVYCSKCGRRYNAERHPKKNKEYYRCINPECHGKYIEVSELEGIIAERFKTVSFSSQFVQKIAERLKLKFSTFKEKINQEKKVLFTQRTAWENKRDIAEEKLFARVISDEDFIRIKEKIRGEIETIQNQINELDCRREVNIDEVFKILIFTRNIYMSYVNASAELKKKYLNFFWDRFEVTDGEIKKTVPSKLFQVLISLNLALEFAQNKNTGSLETINRDLVLNPKPQNHNNSGENKVRLRSDWCPDQSLMLNLFKVVTDYKYMLSLKEKMEDIIEYCKFNKLPIPPTKIA